MRAVAVTRGILAVFACVTCFDVKAETGPEIQVREQSEIAAFPEALAITLGDIAEFRNIDEADMAKLRAIRLGDAPKRGESRSFTDVGLSLIFRDALRRMEEANGERIALVIPSRVTAFAKAAAIDEKAVRQQIAAHIRGTCVSCEVEISSLALPAIASALPTGATWRLKMRAEIPRGSFSIPFEIESADGKLKTYWVSGVSTLRKLVPVARRLIGSGEKIGKSDWSAQLRDLTFFSEAVAEESEMKSAWTTRAISPGEMIGRGAFRREAAIKSGDPVLVTAGADDWQVSAEGVAQQQGFVGDAIRVRVARSLKIVTGILKDNGLVEVNR